MLCENDAENHHDLDSDRDTEEEIETTVRFDSFQTFYLLSRNIKKRVRILSYPMFALE